MPKPYTKVRAGQMTATIWENEREFDGKKKTVYSTQIEKNYTDKEGKWQTTNNFNTDELPKLIAVAQAAYELLQVKIENQS